MPNTKIHSEENEYEDGDHDQFDLGTSFDDLEPGYFENQTHLPADIQSKNEREFNEKYEEEYGSDEGLYGDSECGPETDLNGEWTEAIDTYNSRKEKLERISEARKIAFDELHKARDQLLQLLDSHKTDTYTTDDYIVRKITRKGRVSYKNAMVDICGGETEQFNYFADKHRGKTLYTLSIRQVQ